MTSVSLEVLREPKQRSAKKVPVVDLQAPQAPPDVLRTTLFLPHPPRCLINSLRSRQGSRVPERASLNYRQGSLLLSSGTSPYLLAIYT
ncbi:hypothetical protein DTO021C3_7906 [Paecilomyces variotii]|nr:hypothetical protein DTO021C3_7906 [Paecilomyces variotii]KAJ9348217.1 hypothetical protein DTO027B9_8431 [Paecilomyces variotii]